MIDGPGRSQDQPGLSPFHGSPPCFSLVGPAVTASKTGTR